MKSGHFRRVALVAEFSVRSHLHVYSGKIWQSSGMPNMVHPKANQPTKEPTFPETWGCMLTTVYEAIL